MDEGTVATNEAPAVEPPAVKEILRRSEKVTEITKAMLKFQSSIKVIPRKIDNTYFKSKYADLAAIWGEIRKPLFDNGLVVMHGTKCVGRKITVTTLLIHTTGEWFESDISMEIVKTWDKEAKQWKESAGPQAVGSCITYGKRYGISALLNVVSEGEDDDGESAQGRNTGKAQKTTTTKARTTGAKPNSGSPKPWNWTGKDDPDPIYDEKAGKYKCNNCAKSCKTDWNDKLAAYVSFCECRFAHNWEAVVPKPFDSQELSDEDAKSGSKKTKGGK